MNTDIDLVFLNRFGYGTDTDPSHVWDLTRYWIRGIDAYADWAHHIYFVTNGPAPQWLRPDHPRLTIVPVESILPQEFLPTENWNAISLYLDRIQGLSDRFVVFDQSTFLIDTIIPEDFFNKENPLDYAIFTIPCPSSAELIHPHVVMNNAAVLNAHFDKAEILRKYHRKFFSRSYGEDLAVNQMTEIMPGFTGFATYPIPLSLLRSSYIRVWAVEKELLQQTAAHRQPSKADVDLGLMRQWNLCEGKFTPQSAGDICCMDLGVDSLKAVTRTIRKKKYPVIGFTDKTGSDFPQVRSALEEAFQSILGRRCDFEKTQTQIDYENQPHNVIPGYDEHMNPISRAEEMTIALTEMGQSEEEVKAAVAAVEAATAAEKAEAAAAAEKAEAANAEPDEAAAEKSEAAAAEPDEAASEKAEAAAAAEQEEASGEETKDASAEGQGELADQEQEEASGEKSKDASAAEQEEVADREQEEAPAEKTKDASAAGIEDTSASDQEEATDALPAEKEGKSAAEQEDMPAAEQADLPAAEREEVSSADREEMPAAEQEKAPAAEQKEITAVEQDVIPAVAPEEAPAAKQDEIPTVEQDEIPAVEQDEIPAAEQDEIPAAEQEEASAEEKAAPVVGPAVNPLAGQYTTRMPIFYGDVIEDDDDDFEDLTEIVQEKVGTKKRASMLEHLHKKNR